MYIYIYKMKKVRLCMVLKVSCLKYCLYVYTICFINIYIYIYIYHSFFNYYIDIPATISEAKERQIVSSLSREELEDRYLRMRDEHIVS